jgi:hypothetical protein
MKKIMILEVEKEIEVPDGLSEEDYLKRAEEAAESDRVSLGTLGYDLVEVVEVADAGGAVES